MKTWYRVTIGVLAPVLIAGCGQSQAAGHPKTQRSASTKTGTPTASTRTQVLRVGAQQYQGSKNLHKFETNAKAHPQSYQAQLEAGSAANVNNHPRQAMSYWQRALQLNPHQGKPYEYIGNIYLDTYNNPQQALGWYKKTIANGPTYDWGWYRVVQLEAHFGHMAAAQKYAAEAAKVLPANNKVLKELQTFVTPTSS